MKTLNNLALSTFLIITALVNAQNKTKTVKTNAIKTYESTKIIMQFLDQTDNKTYECSNIYYKKTKVAPESKIEDYDFSISCYGTADNKQLEWAANPKMLKNLKITVTKGLKKIREYELKNAILKTYSESQYNGETTETNFTGAYDFTLEAEQVIINGIVVKGS